MKRFFILLSALSFLFSGSLVAHAQYGLEETAGAAGLPQGDVSTLAGRIVGTALSMIGVLFFILMIYAGFLWMTARGNEQQIEKAKTTMTAAVIGIIVVLSSYAITRFVFQAVGGGGGSCQLQQPVPQSTPPCTASECVGVSTEAACVTRTCCIWQ